ncbi:MAG: tRNA dihydrouridine synthase DusB [Clostridia bacterium]|nr:tRNA dihydrouridine synthase DusB [Clostridia bacterium]
MKIGNVEIKGFTALAPMAGVADTAFRLICRECGAAYVVGEMASAKGLMMSDRKTAELLTVTPAERPMAVQLFGDDPGIIAAAVKKAASFGPDIIDINMGCPVPKVAGNGGGSALMKNPSLAGHIIEAAVKATVLPVTVKLRKGWDASSVNAVEIAKIAQECGAAAVTIHGRTRDQMYAPPADLTIIAAVKAAVKIPVIGNGDVRTPEEARHMLEATGCDLVMIGRGALGAPWVFAQTEQFLREGFYDPAPELPARMEMMVRHITLLCALRGEEHGMREARKHAAWYFRGTEGAASLRADAGRLETLEDLRRLAQRAQKLSAGR